MKYSKIPTLLKEYLTLENEALAYHLAEKEHNRLKHREKNKFRLEEM